MKRKNDLDYCVEAILEDIINLPDYLDHCERPENELYKILEKRLPEYFIMPEGWNQ